MVARSGFRTLRQVASFLKGGGGSSKFLLQATTTMHNNENPNPLRRGGGANFFQFKSLQCVYREGVGVGGGLHVHLLFLYVNSKKNVKKKW